MKMRPGYRRQSRCCLVAWKRKMLHEVARQDVIGGHQAYIHRLMGPRILHLAKTTRGSREARRDYKLASRE